jgi:hypothetical protein
MPAATTLTSAEELLRQERREKMRQLQQDLDPCQLTETEERTSAPSVRQVGQFQEVRGHADRKEQERLKSEEAEAREKRLNYLGKRRISEVDT